MFGIIFFCRHSVGGQRVLTVVCTACATERSLTELEDDDNVDTLDKYLHTHGRGGSRILCKGGPEYCARAFNSVRAKFGFLINYS